MARLMRAKILALSTSSKPGGSSELKVAFSSMGATLCQSLASSVCSAVRVEPVALPTALTSFMSVAYSAEVSAGEALDETARGWSMRKAS